MINATNSGKPKELIPAGNYVARCYQMIHIGTVMEDYKGSPKLQNKVRLGWELPTELKVFDEAKGEQPLVISNEYTLSLGEKANLRKILASWRGKDFTEEEAQSFDVTKLLGVPCMLNIIHKTNADGTKTYANIATISPLPKGFECPEQVNKTILLDYDNFDKTVFNSMPDFIREKIVASLEYVAMNTPAPEIADDVRKGFEDDNGNIDDLPF